MKKIRKKKIYRKKQNNKGLTLIELVVTVAIIGIFSAVVLSAVAAGANFYRNVSSRTKTQIDIQELEDDVENMIMDANTSISYTDGDGTGKSILTVFSKYLKHNGRYPAQYTDIMEWDPSQKTVSYTRQTIGTEEIFKEVPMSVIADNVEDFSVDLSKVEKENIAEFQITINNKGKEDSVTCTVHIRNKVKVQ